jgi:hypothetical protein
MYIDEHNAYRILVEDLKGRAYFGDMGADGRMILNWMLKRYEVEGMDCVNLSQDRDKSWGFQHDDEPCCPLNAV